MDLKAKQINKQHDSIVFASASLTTSRFLPSVMDCDVKVEEEINLFLLNLPLVMPFYHSNGNLRGFGLSLFIVLICFILKAFSRPRGQVTM